MNDDITRYIAFEGMTREEAKEWMHDMAARCKVPDHLFMDGQSEEWKAMFRATYPEDGMKDGTRYNRWNTPTHHNARPPRKCRRHERRKFRNWWKRIAKHEDCKPWDDLCTHRPNIHPEPDGA